MNGRRYTVACLSGEGVGPELMAEASRALHAVSPLHCFTIDDVHVPFAGEARVRSGQLFPHSTRTACLDADAVLVAAASREALDAVASELDLRASVVRVQRAQRAGLVLVAPIGSECAWSIGRAFELARSRRGRLISLDVDRHWHGLVDGMSARYEAVVVEHLPPAAALPALAFKPSRFDVVVSPGEFLEALVGVAEGAEPGHSVVASGRLAKHGPSLFVPASPTEPDLAGQGVANPSAMLLATALMLGEGLGLRAAAETLLGAVTSVLGNGTRTPDLAGSGVGSTTREFVDVVLSWLPSAATNVEFAREAIP